MHLPCCFILWYLFCKTNLLFMLCFHFSQVTVIFWWWCPPGMLWWQCCRPEVLTLSVSLAPSAGSSRACCPLPFSTGTFPTTPRPPSEGLSFCQLLSIFLELLHVCLHRKEDRFCLLRCCDVKEGRPGAVVKSSLLVSRGPRLEPASMHCTLQGKTRFL
jgi:hypothetical protein